MCRGLALGLSWSVLSCALLIRVCAAAPGQTDAHREEGSVAAVAYPFQNKEENHRLLQSYIDFILKEEGQERPEIHSWEQQVFFLFRLHDYDRSRFLDGLEMIKLLNDFNSFHSPGVTSNDEVVSLVDFVLQTQDLNHDGLLSPSELLLPPVLTELNETVKDTFDGAQNEVDVKMEAQTHQVEITEERPPATSVEEDMQQKAQHDPATGQAKGIPPVHQGQPEI